MKKCIAYKKVCILDRIFQKFKARFYFIRKLALIVSKIEKSNSKNLGLKIGFCNLDGLFVENFSNPLFRKQTKYLL